MLTTKQAIHLATSQGFILQRGGAHWRYKHNETGALVTIPHKMKSETISKKIEKQIRAGQSI